MEITKPKDNLNSSESSGIVRITKSNFDSVLASSEVVLIFFYSGQPTRDSSRLMAKFVKAAAEVANVGFSPGKVLMGKVNYGKEKAMGTQFHLAYDTPSIKLFRNGLLSKYGYSGKSVEEFVEFIKEQCNDPIVRFNLLDELHNLSEIKRHAIAYLDNRDQPEYNVIRKVATALKDDWQFYVKFDGTAQQSDRLSTAFRSTGGTLVEFETYAGSLLSYDGICTWIQQKYFPLLQELTFNNERQLIYRRKPFLLLLHTPTDTDSVRKFKRVIESDLVDEFRKYELQFLITDGVRMKSLLLRLGKTMSDLPLIVTDYCIAAYHAMCINIFDFNVVEQPGKLKELLNKPYVNLTESSHYTSHLLDDEDGCQVFDLYE